MSFVSDSSMGMGGSDFRGSIQQPLVDHEVIPIGDFCSKEIHYETFDDESSSSERLVDPRHVGWGTSHPRMRVKPYGAPLDKEHVLVTTILPCYQGRGA